MGYNIRITRNEDEEGNGDITKEEWFAIVAKDPALTMREKDTVKNPDTGDVLVLPSDGTAVWKHDGEMTRFALYHGVIQSKFPSEQAVEKMQDIAAELSAKVVGEEGEEYTRDGKPIIKEKPKKERWKMSLPLRIVLYISIALTGLSFAYGFWHEIILQQPI